VRVLLEEGVYCEQSYMHACALSRMLPVELFFIQYYSDIYSAVIDVAPPNLSSLKFSNS
jgi:hypothetical protein